MSDLTIIKGIGDKTASMLATAGIRTPADLVRTFPVRYERHVLTDAGAARSGEAVAVSAVVREPASVAYLRRNLTKLTVVCDAEGLVFRVAVYRREFLRQALVVGARIVATGRFESGKKVFIASDLVLAGNYREGILPVYGIEGISDRMFSKYVAAARSLVAGTIRENLPQPLLVRRSLASVTELLDFVHAPKDEDEIDRASRRVKYEELLRFALAVRIQKRRHDAVKTIPKHYDITRVREFIRSLPFELTIDQKQATNEIFRDLKAPRRMLRLLQGDVGSGKTVCAAIAVYAVHTAGYQTAVMAPTEILARQHAANLTSMLQPFGVKVVFLSGSVRGKERETVAAALADGSAAVVCGTHALIQEAVGFRNLGFVVIDEQHRFGVEQRRVLREKGFDPDVLAMSATPIPRTLAIALFGDMDVSTIHTMPAGRMPIATDIVDFTAFAELMDRVAEEIAAGRKAYVIAPLVFADSSSDAFDVAEAAALVRKHLPAGVAIGVLHGRMKAVDKEATLASFRTGSIDVLVATTVVEVGVDVPSATVMVILNAERFGLSQLHQLRGRIGRGADRSSCHLVTDIGRSEDSRLDVLVASTDGFVVAEEDLRRRGPGDVFGEEQTGLPRFKAANVVTDAGLLEAAFTDADLMLGDQDAPARALVAEAETAVDSYHLD
jgi:ATP-dependent DNA helicase RecG